MQSQPLKFFSISKFVELMKEKNRSYMSASVYFESSDTFKNKFGKICIKPVMLQLSTLGKHEYIKHQQILDMFDGQLVLYFKESRSRYYPNNQNDLFYLLINFEKQECVNYEYYHSEMFRCGIKKNVMMIRKQEVKATGDENEIPDDAF